MLSVSRHLPTNWQDIWQLSTQKSVFTRAEFIEARQQAYDSELVVLHSRSAYVAFEKTSDHSLTSVGGDELVDYFGVAGESSVRFCQEAISNFTELDLNQVVLESIAADSPLLDHLSQACATNNTWDLEIQQVEVCPQVELPSSWDEYLQFVGRKQRHEIRRKERNLRKEFEVEHEVITGENVIKSLNDFIRLHQLSSADKANFWDEKTTQNITQFIEGLASSEVISLHFLKADEIRVASMLIFDVDDQYQLYNSGFNPEYGQWSVGNVLLALTIKDAISHQKQIYDFMRGDENYKFKFGAISQPLFQVTLANK